jgi:hypothetical protein
MLLRHLSEGTIEVISFSFYFIISQEIYELGDEVYSIFAVSTDEILTYFDDVNCPSLDV